MSTKYMPTALNDLKNLFAKAKKLSRTQPKPTFQPRCRLVWVDREIVGDYDPEDLFSTDLWHKAEKKEYKSIGSALTEMQKLMSKESIDDAEIYVDVYIWDMKYINFGVIGQIPEYYDPDWRNLAKISGWIPEDPVINSFIEQKLIHQANRRLGL